MKGKMVSAPRDRWQSPCCNSSLCQELQSVTEKVQPSSYGDVDAHASASASKQHEPLHRLHPENISLCHCGMKTLNDFSSSVTGRPRKQRTSRIQGAQRRYCKCSKTPVCSNFGRGIQRSLCHRFITACSPLVYLKGMKVFLSNEMFKSY